MKDSTKESIVRDSMVEKAVYSMLSSSRNPFDYPRDLIQDIYLMLFTKGDEIEDMYQRGELGYYILRVVRNQLLSRNSPYYYTYIKNAIYEDVEEYKDTLTED